MNTFAQWIHQHDFMILLGAILLGSSILLSWFRLWTKKRVLVWGTSLGLAVVFLFSLRTPAATVSMPTETAVLSNTSTIAKVSEQTNALENGVIELNSIEEIEQYLQNGAKPTLIEFYSDFGVS